MLTEHVDLLYTAIWSLAIANVFGAGLSIFLAKPITSLTIVPFNYLAPFMILIITFASYQATRSWGDLIALINLIQEVFMPAFKILKRLNGKKTHGKIY